MVFATASMPVVFARRRVQQSIDRSLDPIFAKLLLVSNLGAGPISSESCMLKHVFIASLFVVTGSTASEARPRRPALTMVRPRVARRFRRIGGGGLASMYPASDWSHVVLRAIMDISARAF